MRRAVITGIGIVSSIGNNVAEVLASLKAGKSGITYSEQFEQYGLRSRVWGNIKLDVAELIDRKVLRFMGEAAAYAYLSMRQAVEDSGLSEDQVSNERTGLIVGSGGASAKNQLEACDTLREKRHSPCRSLHGDPYHVLHDLCLSGDPIQDQRGELLPELCLCHFRSLYR